jgi:hypothetical protein
MLFLENIRGIREALAITGKELTQALENSSFTQEGRAVIDQNKSHMGKTKTSDHQWL